MNSKKKVRTIKKNKEHVLRFNFYKNKFKPFKNSYKRDKPLLIFINKNLNQQKNKQTVNMVLLDGQSPMTITKLYNYQVKVDLVKFIKLMIYKIILLQH